MVSGSSPKGLSLRLWGLLEGKPSVPGTYSFQIETENAADGTIGVTNTIVVS